MAGQVSTDDRSNSGAPTHGGASPELAGTTPQVTIWPRVWPYGTRTSRRIRCGQWQERTRPESSGASTSGDSQSWASTGSTLRALMRWTSGTGGIGAMH